MMLTSSPMFLTPESPTKGSISHSWTYNDLTSLAKEQPARLLSNNHSSSRLHKDFEQIRILGSGGFATIFEARNRLDGVNYAIKQIRILPKAAQNHLTEMLTEVTALATLVHPHIVRYYQAWVEEEAYDFLSNPISKKSPVPCTLFISEHEDNASDSSTEFFDIFSTKQNVDDDLRSSATISLEEDKAKWEDLKKHILRSLPPQRTYCLYVQMQLCSDDLASYLEKRKSVDIEKNIIIFTQILKGLEYVHQKGLIHRDLKPANIFFLKSFDSEIDFDSVVIGDFGLATTELDAKEKIEMAGTFIYMSPEQRNGKPYNQKSDIYSLGIMLFEMFNIFGTQMERIHLLTKLHESTLPKEFQQKYPDESRLILKMCASVPHERPSASQLLRTHYLTNNIVSPSEYRSIKQKLNHTEKLVQELQQKNESQTKLIEEKNKNLDQKQEIIENQAKRIAELERLLLKSKQIPQKLNQIS